MRFSRVVLVVAVCLGFFFLGFFIFTTTKHVNSAIQQEEFKTLKVLRTSDVRARSDTFANCISVVYTSNDPTDEIVVFRRDSLGIEGSTE